MKYSFHPDASKELEAACDYYDAIDPNLGNIPYLPQFH
jgi:hypothetical protein